MSKLNIGHIDIPDTYFIDADTYRDDEGKVRAADMWAPEVEHFGPDGKVTNAEYGGNFRTKLYSRLAEDTGYDSLYRTGEEDKHDRSLGWLQDNMGGNFTNKLVYEGLEQPVNDSQQELHDMGVFTRALDEAEGITDVDSPWHKAREDVLDYYSQTFQGWKMLATNEASLASANEY